MPLTPDRLARDIDFALGHAGGVPVVYAGVEASGVLEAVDEVVLPEASVIGARLTVVVRNGSVPAPQVGDQIRVDGATYIVRDHRREGDGMLLRIFLGLP